MSKKANTVLVIGGLALGIYALSKYLVNGGTAASDGGGGGGGGGDAWLPYVPELTPGEQTITDVVKQIFSTGGAALGPASPDYLGGVYPALDVNEAGLFVNRATGEVYPVDPATGRQRYRVGENGEVEGAHIANEQGIPYGTYEYETVPAAGLQKVYTEEEFGLPGGGAVTVNPMYGVTKESTGGLAESVSITSKATGITQSAIVGVNPSTGAGYVWYGVGY